MLRWMFFILVTLACVVPFFLLSICCIKLDGEGVGGFPRNASMFDAWLGDLISRTSTVHSINLISLKDETAGWWIR